MDSKNMKGIRGLRIIILQDCFRCSDGKNERRRSRDKEAVIF
jgi:hypothetical protein